MGDSVESLIDQFSQLNLGKMHSTISSSKEEGPDLKELYKKAQSFRQRFKKLGSKKEKKKKLIEEIKDCISTAKFSPKNIDRVQEGIRRANPGVGELEPLDWILTLEILIYEVQAHRIRHYFADLERLRGSMEPGTPGREWDHDVTMKVNELLREDYRAGSKPKKKAKTKKKDKKKTKKLKKATLKELIQIAKKHKISYKGKTKKQIADSLSASRSSKLTKKEKLAIIPFCSSNKNKKLLLR